MPARSMRILAVPGWCGANVVTSYTLLSKMTNALLALLCRATSSRLMKRGSTLTGGGSESLAAGVRQALGDGFIKKGHRRMSGSGVGVLSTYRGM